MAESYVDDTNLLISFDLKEKTPEIAHIRRGPIHRQQVVLPELRTKNLIQIKLNSWLLEADRKIKRIKLAPSRKKSVMYPRSATLAFKFMTGLVPDYHTSKFTKR